MRSTRRSQTKPCDHVKLTGKSHVAVGNALAQLQAAGVLKALNERKWGRVSECSELLALVDDFERSVSTP